MLLKGADLLSALLAGLWLPPHEPPCRSPGPDLSVTGDDTVTWLGPVRGPLLPLLTGPCEGILHQLRPQLSSSQLNQPMRLGFQHGHTH